MSGHPYLLSSCAMAATQQEARTTSILCVKMERRGFGFVNFFGGNFYAPTSSGLSALPGEHLISQRVIQVQIRFLSREFEEQSKLRKNS